MFYAVLHHRAVVQRVIDLGLVEYDAVRGTEPVSQRAVDACLYVFARRPDLAIGTSVEPDGSGGLRVDMIRNQREIILEIDDRGRALVMAGSFKDQPPVASDLFTSKEAFIGMIAECIKDPLSGARVNRSTTSPYSGELGDVLSHECAARHIKSDAGDLIGLKLASSPRGFGYLCFQPPNKDGAKITDMEKVVSSAVTSGVRFNLARTFRGSEFVSIHDLSDMPREAIGRSKLPCGKALGKFCMDLNERRTRSN